ncbi:MAG: hypothetical protein V1678_00565, partial [Candidatus Aenigmatarchaeota archaeon]
MENKARIIGDFCDLGLDDRIYLKNLIAEAGEYSGFVPNVKINNEDFFVFMKTEEASVLAAASAGASRSYRHGGVEVSVQSSLEYSKAMGQVQLYNVRNPNAKVEIIKNKERLLGMAKEVSNAMEPLDFNVEEYEGKIGKMMIVNLNVDPKDAMGAAKAAEMADTITEELSRIAESEYNRGINSNYAGRLTKSRIKIPVEEL